jgi:hypothetical protein
MINKIRTLIVALLIASSAFAQDNLFLRGKEEAILVKVIEIGTSEVKYKLWPVDESLPTMVENKDRIKKIVFANGTVMKFAEDEFTNEANYTTQRKIAIKWDPFIIPRGVISLSGEYSIKPGMSAEVGVGYIGIGDYSSSDIWDFDKANGFFIRAGVKFINTPDYKLKGMRYTHILKGGYVKPEIVYLNHINTRTSTSLFSRNSSAEWNIKGGGFFLNFGKQWVFNDIFLVDFFVGPGLGIKNIEYISNTSTNNYINYSDPSKTGMFAFSTLSEQYGKIAFSVQTGLKIGFLFGAKKDK